MINTIYIYTREDGVRLHLTYSDQSYYIYKEGQPDILYVEAIDVENRLMKSLDGFQDGKLVTYKESDKKIEHPPKENE
jgi:hypothetical protein